MMMMIGVAYQLVKYTMKYCTIFAFYVGMRLELDYNNNLYWL